MKQHELTFSIIKIPLDFLVICAAFFVAKEIRLISDLIPGVSLPIQTIQQSSLNIFALYWAVLYIFLFASHRLYSLQMTHSKIQEILDIIRYGIYWFLFFSVGVYFGNGILYTWIEIPRLIILFSMILGILGSIFVRILLNIIQSYLLRKKIIPKRKLLLVTNKSEKSMQSILQDIRDSKIYNIVAYANDKKKKNITLPYLWGIKEIEKLISQHLCDELLYIDSDFSKDKLYKIWEISKIYGVRYRYISNNFDVTKTNTSLSLINHTPVIEIQNTPLENWGRVWKRLFDISLSLWICITWLPLWILIVILIKIEDPSGPAIYKNRRIWQHGKIFNCYKFRYLKWKHCVKESYWVNNNDDPAIQLEQELIQNKSTRNGPLYKIKKDPRKTKIWTFLEKYSLDEVPQFLNVITWSMSIVWPRPHQPREVMQYEQYQERLLTIKPGITGMAQVNGRDENNFALEAKLDIFYIENWRFLLDLKIMMKTFVIILTRK
jgi:exopolysaccharide biosynthesis polyprenyl glycosylphosphotransferase